MTEKLSLRGYIFDDMDGFNECLRYTNEQMKQSGDYQPLVCKPMIMNDGRKAFSWSSDEATEMYEGLLSSKYGNSVEISIDDFYHISPHIKIV